MTHKKKTRGFTLVETLIAITLLSIAIVAPMSLTTQSLGSAYYSRDQITAFYLAQEAIEALRSIRDAQILVISQTSSASGLNIFGPIPITTAGSDHPFTIDARVTDPGTAITPCSPRVPGGPCDQTPLQTDETHTLYGYQAGWSNTTFTRTVRASFVGSSQDELRVTVTVTWKTGTIQTRTFSISENLYRWIPDGVSQ